MAIIVQLQVAVCLFIIGSICVLGVPIDDAGAAGVPTQISSPAAVTPDASSTPVVEPVVPASNAAQSSANLQGNGVISEHKSPDGSTLTITRFEGPLPAGVFPSNPYGYFPSASLQSLYNSQLSQLQSMALLYRDVNTWNYLNSANAYYANLANYANLIHSNSLLTTQSNPLWYSDLQYRFPSSTIGQWPGPGFAAGPPPQFFYPWFNAGAPNFPSQTRPRVP